MKRGHRRGHSLTETTQDFLNKTMELIKIKTPMQQYYHQKYANNPTKKLAVDIYYAAKTGDHQLLSRLLQKRVENDPYFLKSKSLNSPLHKAVKNGHFTCVMLLLANQFPVDLTNAAGETAFLIAVKNSNVELINLLLEFNANLQIADATGNYPIHYISRAAFHQALVSIHDRLSIESSNLQFSINQTNKKGKTGLHLITKRHNGFLKKAKKLAQLMLEMDAEPNIQDGKGNTPLHIAASVGALSICELLIMHGADRSLRNMQNKVPSELILSKFSGSLILDDLEINFLRKNLGELLKVTKRSRSSMSTVPSCMRSTSPGIKRTNNSDLQLFEEALQNYKDDLKNEIALKVVINVSNYFMPVPRESMFTSINILWTVREAVAHICGVLSIQSSPERFGLFRPNADGQLKRMSEYATVASFNLRAKDVVLFQEKSAELEGIFTPRLNKVKTPKLRRTGQLPSVFDDNMVEYTGHVPFVEKNYKKYNCT